MSLHAFRDAESGRRWPSRGVGPVMNLEPQPNGSILMDTVERELKAAIERRLRRTARLAYIDAVSIVASGRLVWNGTVLVFDLAGSPEAERVYAWFPSDGESDDRARIVRHGPRVQSAQDAVASVIAPATRTDASAPHAGGPGPAQGEAVALRHLES